jgi:2-polyprenyl-3-methyl-5-hydroxy-6-metoxy-1,4-benzoquinol methylase
MDRDEVARRIWNYNWYHVIDLGDGLRTPGMEVNMPSQRKVLDAIRSIDFRGARVLDIGCRDGLYCFEAERLGAAEVIGIDNDLSRGAVELLIPAMGSRVRMEQMNLLDLVVDTFGRFDVVLFAGVLYHLRYPFEAMRVIRDLLVDGGRLVVETAVFADANRHAYLYCPIGDENPYDATSVTLFNTKGLRDSLRSFGLMTESEKLQCAFEPDPTDVKKVIDRVCLVCRKEAADVQPSVQRYWEGLHGLHSGAATSLD